MSTEPSTGADATLSDVVHTPGERTGLAPGTTLAGRYRVEKLIGEGGMGDVYLATHLKIDKAVAIKVLAPEQTRRPRTVSRFLQEAKAASKIRHDNVVDITDFGEDEGRAFFVMEHLAGEDLGFLVKREGRLPWKRARRIAIQLLEGLAAAHAAGIVHRDVKPQNCFIVPRDDRPELVKVIDFGIAKVRDGSEEQLTRTGAIMGTADYMSPEQGQGAELDGRSDLYSVGVILYRMLTGRVPFKAGNAMAILYQHVNTQATPPSEACPEAELGPAIDGLIAKAMAKDPDERFATAEEFIAALRAIEEPGVGTGKDGKRSVGLWIGVAAVVVAMVGGAAVFMAGGDDAAVVAGGGDSRAKGADANGGAARAGDAGAGGPNAGGANAGGADAGGADAGGADAGGADAGEANAGEANAGEANAGGADAGGANAGEADAGEASDAADANGAEAADAEAADAEAADADPSSADDGEEASADEIPNRRPQRKLDSVLRRLGSKISACGKKGGLFPGEKVGVSIEIAPNGRASSVTVKGSASAAGKTCVTNVINGARFGPAKRPQDADHNFTI